MSSTPVPAKPHDLVVPPLGETISQAVVARWLKKPGEFAKADEPVAELETDKVTIELRAPVQGVLIEQRVAEGTTVEIGQVIGQLDEAGVQKAETDGSPPDEAGVKNAQTDGSPGQNGKPSAAPAEQTATPRARGGASPSARRAAHKQDVDKAVAAPPTPVVAAKVRVPTEPRPDTPSQELEQVVPMSPLRQAIAKRLVAAQHETASLSTFNEVDMTAVLALRSRDQESFQRKYQVKLGIMSFFIKAAVTALEAFPGLNAEVRQDKIVYKRTYNIGVAIGSGRGLVVPVLRRADALSFAEMEQAIAQFSDKAKQNRLTVEDLSGGTFTITNGGVFGSMLSTPIINYPQTGILGMHNIVRRPVAVEDRVEIRPIMYVALTYDHRVVDGREAVSFLVHVKQSIESPERMLLEV